MKIQGRFIAVLAVLGLLIALLPLASAGAVTGVVTLKGGGEDKGLFFSDQTNYNILTVEVKDADLTPVRIGTARSTAGAGTTVDLTTYTVAGEKDKTDRFDGGEDNPLCDLDEDDTTDNARPTELGPFTTSIDTDRFDANGDPLTDCQSRGDAFVIDGDTDAERTWTFTLSDIARDRQTGSADGVGENEIMDIISVVVNGRAAVRSEDNVAAPSAGSGPWFTVRTLDPATVAAPGSNTPGGGIDQVIVRRVAPQDAANSVSVTYRVTEFDFGDATTDSETPLNLAQSKVKYGGATSFANVPSEVTVSTVGDTTITTTGGISDYTVVTFAYDVRDSKEELVTLNSGTAGDRKLDTMESAAGSDVFEAKVAIFSQADHTKILQEASNVAGNDDGTVALVNGVETDNDIVNIDELNVANGLSPADQASNTGSLAMRVTSAATELGLAGSDPAKDLVDLIIPARHGDIINVVYADANPSTRVSKTATVDLEAPKVTLISPDDGLYTNARTVTLSADVVDAGAGVAETEIDLKIQADTSGVSLGTQIRTPIVDGYRVTMNPEGVISEGPKEWFVGVKDKVGNEPVMDIPECGEGEGEGEGVGGADVPCTGTAANEAPKGAGSFEAPEADNPFKFTVDTRAPTLSTGETGLNLKNPGVTSGADKETQGTNSRTWIRVVFDTGDGEAPLDASTVEANDFRVDDLAPLAAKINAVTHGETEKGTAVYLQVGQMDTDARPEVVLSGEIRDRAGNIRTDGRLTAVADGLNPMLEVTPSTSLAKSEVVVTISSSESLRSNPVVEVTITKPVKPAAGEALELVDESPLRVSLVTGSLTRWEATFRNQVNQASRQYVVVKGTDLADNTATVGGADKEDDIVTFQVDDRPPTVKFMDASGKSLKDAKQTEGAVWMVAQFDEDEYMDDKSRGVTVTALSLTDLSDDSVVTDDASGVFDSEADCVDHGVTGNVTLDGAGTSTKATPAQTNKCAERTLAVTLTPGSYNIAMTGVDAIGNEVSGNTDFTVIESAPFKLDLRPGVNFISIPGMPMADGGNINMLLGSHPVTTVATYDRSLALQGQNPWLRATKDAETGMFSGDITTIEPGKAYFITATASSVVEVKLQQAVVELPPTIPVRQGFNAIGFWSPSGATSAEIDDYLNSIGWTVAYSYDPTPGRGWETIRRGETDEDGIGKLIEQGKGYLVYATYDAVLTP